MDRLKQISRSRALMKSIREQKAGIRKPSKIKTASPTKSKHSKSDPSTSRVEIHNPREDREKKEMAAEIVNKANKRKAEEYRKEQQQKQTVPKFDVGKSTYKIPKFKIPELKIGSHTRPLNPGSYGRTSTTAETIVAPIERSVTAPPVVIARSMPRCVLSCAKEVVLPDFFPVGDVGLPICPTICAIQPVPETVWSDKRVHQFLERHPELPWPEPVWDYFMTITIANGEIKKKITLANGQTARITIKKNKQATVKYMTGQTEKVGEDARLIYLSEIPAGSHLNLPFSN